MIKSDEKKDDISKDEENKDSTKDTKTPSKPLLPKSAILKLLAELVKSYAGVSQLVTEYSHNAKLSSASEVSGNFSLGNLSKDAFERRMSTGSGLFTFLSSGTSVKKLSNTNCIASRHINDQFRCLGNCAPTPPLSHHFALSKN